MKIIKAVLLTVAVVLSTSLVPAQIAPFGIQNNDLGPVPSGPPDSIVQLTADTQGLPAVSPDQIPFSGTFWTIMPGFGFPLPFPCPPPGVNLPTYALPDGSFLVDDSATNSTSEADLIWQATEVTNLIGQAQAETSLAQNRPLARAMDDGLPSPGDAGGAGEVITNALVVPPDYGTNLWIAQTAITSGYLTGIGTNTLADVPYTILGLNDLTQPTNWVSLGAILGSETTNWTPLNPLPVVFQTNLFVKLRSEASSDGSGLPTWWELEYFGTTGIDANALDSAGDGWTIYQKYQLGVNPNVFYTSPAPQALTATYDNANGMGVVTWLPSPGPVTSYTLVKQDDDTGANTTFTLSATNTSFADNLSGDIPVFGSELIVNYTLNANYGANGSSAPASASIDGGNDNSYPAATLVTGPLGRLYLVLATTPNDLSTVRIYRQNDFSKATGVDDDYTGNGADSYASLADGYFEIPAASLTNGIGVLPDSQMPPFFQFDLFVQTVRSNGLASAWTGPFTMQASMPFADARSQLKDNLRFVLRDTGPNGPFAFGAQDYGTYAFPASHAFASYYSSGENLEFDPLRPLFDNGCYCNFVYAPGKLDDSGFLDTGCYYGDLYFGYNDDSLLSLSNTLTYYFDVADYLALTNPVVPLSQITTNDSTWILPTVPPFGNAAAGQVNFYGLPYVSQVDEYVSNNEVYEATLYPGQTNLFDGGANIYFQIAQPVFEPAGYYFTRYFADGYNGLMPEEGGFSPTNTTQTMIVGLGFPLNIAGYAQFIVSNTPCYLGQYFDQAYAIDTNGTVTANPTGLLSPYGNFFATQPGPVALVTMPDVDTGARGTCEVDVVSLQLDANHDGIMDLSYFGGDATSFNSPFVFWCNNNFDRWAFDGDDNTNYMDDVEIEGCPYRPNTATSDCNYLNEYGERAISCTRDLEDYARLWLCGVTTNLLAQLPYGSSVTLSWGDVGRPNPSDPTIDLFQAADTNGGLGYLTNETVAVLQTNLAVCPYVGRLMPGGSLQLNSLDNNLATTHFIWCGVSNGIGSLTLTISDQNGNILAQTEAYIQIKDIKQMYERWTVGDQPSVAPLTNAVLATEGLPAGAPAFQYPAPQNTNTPYIFLVHGWNNPTWAKDRFAECAFKRLYWQGYQGRFGEFRWPTGFNFNGTLIDAILQPHNYDSSEYTAWQSAAGLLNKLSDLNAKYPGQVYMLAHSMGNVVAGEALRLAAQNGEGQIVNTYIASQAAIPAHVYDATVTAPYLIDYTYFAHGYPAPGAPQTPNIYGNRLTNNAAAVGRRISFYNINDYALAPSAWCWDQEHKPDTYLLNGYYYYTGSTNDAAPWNHFEYVFSVGVPPPSPTVFDIVNDLNDRHTVLAYAANPYSTALGATPNVLNISENLDLTTVWPTDTTGHDYAAHFWHSAEFRGDCPQEWDYWNTLLFSSQYGFNIHNP